MKNVLRSLLGSLAIAAAGCSVSADKAIPCFDDSACPADYPKCDGAAAGASGFCRALGAGETLPTASISIAGVEGHAPATTVGGVVNVDVAARAASGIKAVTLTSDQNSAGYKQLSVQGALYRFEVDTTKATGASLKLTASVQPADGTAAVTATQDLAFDNAAPRLSLQGDVSGTNARPGSLVALTVTSNKPLAHVKGTISLEGGAFTDTMLETAAAAGSPANSYALSYQIPAGASAGTYDITVDATDTIGNATAAGAAIAPVKFVVRRPFTPVSLTAAGAVAVGGVPAGKLGGSITATLVLPGTVDLGTAKPSFTMVDANGATRALSAVTSAGGGSFTATDAVGAGDASGIATITASFTDASGNSASAHTSFLIDRVSPLLSGISVGKGVVDAIDGTQTLLAYASEPLSAASVSTSNNDAGNCTFAAGAAPVLITCTVTLSHPAPSGSPAAVVATIRAVDLVGNASAGGSGFTAGYVTVATPTASGLTGDQAIVTASGQLTLTPSFSDGAGSVNGVGVTSGQPYVVTPAGPSSLYTLTVTNGAGHSDVATFTVGVVPAPVITTALAASVANLTLGQAVTLTAATANGAARLNGASFSGSASLTPAALGPASFTLTVTNGATNPVTVSQTVTVNVVDVPAVTSFTAGSGSATAIDLTQGNSTVLKPVFPPGLTGTISGVGPVVSGQLVPISPATLGANGYTLTVTNAAGSTTTAQVTVTVDAVPQITSFTVAAPNVGVNGATTMTAVFSGGTASVDQGIGLVTTGTPKSTGALAATTTFTLTVTNAAGSTAVAQATVAVAGNATASLSIVGAASPLTVTAGTAVNLLPVCGANQTGAIGGIGSITSTSVIAVTPAGATTTYVLTCTNAASQTATSSVTVLTVAAPTITTFSASQTSITAGQGVTLSFTFAGGSGDVDGAPVVSGTPISPTVNATHTFILTVKNAASPQASVTAQVSVSVVAAPIAAGLAPSAGSITAGQAVTLTPTFSLGTATIDNGVGSVTNGGSFSVSPAQTTTYTLTVTNSLGFTATKSATVTVVAAPQITAFSVAPGTIDSTNASLVFTYGFSGGTASISGGVGTVSGTSKTVSTGLPTSQTTYVLTVTNSLGVSTGANATVNVVPVVSPADTFVASPATVTIGQASTLTPSIQAGETATFNGAAVVNGQAVAVAPPLGSTNYSLIVSNAAGHTRTITTSVTAVAKPVINTFNSSASVVTASSTFSLSYDFSGGTAQITSAALASPITGLTSAGFSTITAPAQAGNATYTLTVTNAAGANLAVSVSVQVVSGAGATLTFGTANGPTTANVNPHGSVSLVPTFSGGTATLDGSAVTSGQSVTVNNLVQTHSFVLAVTSPTGNVTQATATATVNAVVSSFAVSPAFVTRNAATTLTFTSSFEGGGVTGTAPGAITPGPVAISSGAGQTATAPVSLGSSQTYTLTVNNSAGVAESPLATATVTAVDPAVGTSLTPASANITQGTSVALTPVFTNDAGGTAVVTLGGATVASGLSSGTPVTVSPASTGANVYTLVVSNRAGMVDNTRTATVNAFAPAQQPASISAVANVTVSSGGNIASVAARSGFTYFWTVSPGATITTGQSASSGSMTYTAPASAGTLLITCDEVDGAGNHSPRQTTQVNIVAAPASPAITSASSVTVSTSFTASVVANPGMTYAWSIAQGSNNTAAISGSTGGAFSGGLNSVSIAVGTSAGTFTVNCIEKNAANAQSASGGKAVIAYAAPVTPSITVGSGSTFVTTGASGQTAQIASAVGSSSYTWGIVGGTFSGGGTTATGTSVTYAVSAAAGSTATLTATELNAAGVAGTPGSKALTVVAVPGTPVITAGLASKITLASTGNAASVPAVANMTHNWTISGTGAVFTGGGTTLQGDSLTFTAASSGNTTLSVTEQNQAGVNGTPATLVLTGVSLPGAATISGAAANVTALTQGLTATCASSNASVFNWTIAGGTITGGQGTFSLTYTAGSAGTVTLTCTGRNDAGSSGTTSANTVINVLAPPAITLFTVDNAHVTSAVAGAMTFTVNTTGVSGNASVTGTCAPAATVAGFSIPLTSGNGTGVAQTAPTVSATSTCNFVVDVVNFTGGTHASASLNVVVEPAPTITSLTFQSSGTNTATFAPGSQVTLVHTYDAKGGSATINSIPAGVANTAFPSIQAKTVYTLTVTNLAGTSVTANATANVAAAIVSFSVGTGSQSSATGALTLTSGDSAKLFATFLGSGASGVAPATLSCTSVSNCAGTLAGTSINSGASVTITGNVNGTLTYTLDVAPAAGGGTDARQNVTVKVVPAATATSLTASATSVHAGAAVTLTPVFSFNGAVQNGSANITGDDGSTYSGLTSGTAIEVSPLATVNYTLNVFNAAGTAAAAPPSVSVTVTNPGTWSAHNTTEPSKRLGATVTPFANGTKVLVAGGYDGTNGGIPLATALVCNAAGACTAPAGTNLACTGVGMSTGRAEGAAALVTAGPHAGQVFIFGGYNAAGPSTPSRKVDYYDPALDCFVASTDIGATRAYHTATLLASGNQVLVAGGIGSSNNTADLYDLTAAAPAVSTIALSARRQRHTATLLPSNQVILIGGGVGELRSDLFNPAAGTFGFSAALPAGEDKQVHTSVLITSGSNAGKVLVSGGLVSNFTVASQTQWLFDPAGPSFTAAPNLSVARAQQGAAALTNGRILICGGISAALTAVGSCDLFDPSLGATGTVLGTAAMVQARSDFSLAPLPVFGASDVFAAGGSLTTTTFSEVYNPN